MTVSQVYRVKARVVRESLDAGIAKRIASNRHGLNGYREPNDILVHGYHRVLLKRLFKMGFLPDQCDLG